MVASPQKTPCCRSGCLLERVPSQQLPLYRVYQFGERIAPEGIVFVICQGLVACSWGCMPEKRCLKIFGPGEIWEEGAYGENELRAIGEARGRWVSQAKWLEVLRDPISEERFLDYHQRCWRRQHEWQLVLARGSVRARVAWQMLDLAQRFGKRDERTQEIFVPVHLTLEQQAQLVGATRARLWEALREFERKKWLVCGHESFLVCDEEALRQQSREGL